MLEELYVDQNLYDGRPAPGTFYQRTQAAVARLPKEMACYDLLDALEIVYTRVDHEPAATIGACEAVERVLRGRICKNLFLCNRQKTNYYLLMLAGEKVFKTKDLSGQLGIARLSFAGPEDMERLLHVKPGSVSVLGLMHDADNQVQLVIDRSVYEQGSVCCHPCVNTSTVQFSMEDLLGKLLPQVHHEPTVVDLPEPEEGGD